MKYLIVQFFNTVIVMVSDIMNMLGTFALNSYSKHVFLRVDCFLFCYYLLDVSFDGTIIKIAFRK